MRIIIVFFISVLIYQNIYSQDFSKFIKSNQIDKIILYPNMKKKISDSLFIKIYERENIELNYYYKKKGNDSVKINSSSFLLENQYMTPDITFFEFENRKYLFICAYLLEDVLFHEGARDGYLFDITEKDNIKKYMFKKKYVSALYFGDFNGDKKLDFLNLEGKNPTESFLKKISSEKIDCYDYFKITCYSLINDSFQILNEDSGKPYYLLCGFGMGKDCEDSSVILESNWFKL